MTNPMIEHTEAGPVSMISMMARPHNFLSPELLEAILDGLAVALDRGARAVVLNSKLRNFSAGAEITFLDELNNAQASPPPYSVQDFLARFEAFQIPVIASVHGVCVGGGFELALACDMIIASKTSKLGCVESSVGLHPLMGAVQRISQRAGASRANEMAMLGRRYDAETLERWNLVNLVVPDERLESVTMAIAAELGNGPTVAHRATKLLNRVAVNEGVAAADAAMAGIQRMIWTSEDAQAGLRSYAAPESGLPLFLGA